MKSKRSHEGVILLDHSASPGIPDQALPGMPPRSGRGKFEAPCYTCSHCQKVVMVNPLRNRDRAWCKKCDHYICDNCGGILAATGVCRTWKQLLDQIQESASRAENTEDVDDGKKIILGSNVHPDGDR